MNRERRLRRRLAALMKADEPPLTGRELLDMKSIISAIPADLEQYEKALATAVIPPRVFVNEKLFERLHDIFGKNIEVMVSNA
jgi:hypothetical protein